LVDERLDLGESFLLVEPIAVTAFTVLREILLQDGHAAELGGQDGLDLRQGIEPLDQWLGLFGIAHSDIELLPDLVGESCDFSSGGHR
jgi:hypothetical protein